MRSHITFQNRIYYETGIFIFQLFFMNELNSNSIIQWIISDGIKVSSIPGFFNSVIEKVNGQGISILRSVVLIRTLHPEIQMIRYAWEPVEVHSPVLKSDFIHGKASHIFNNSRVLEIAFSHGGVFSSPQYLLSPYKALDDGTHEIHCHISPEMTEFEFPVLKDLQQIGATDFYVISLNSQNEHNGLKNIISFATSRKGGFTEFEIEFFKEIIPVFSLCLEMHVNHYITSTLLKVYLGQHSGELVLKGKIQRGDVEKIEAAIWYSDLRGFTEMSENYGSSKLVEWLNEYFEIMAKSIALYNGEILKFIGDAILAIFPLSEPSQREIICQKTLESAKNANRELDLLNSTRREKGLPCMEHGIALHYGEVQYGNIGAVRRLDFTVIGQTVNLAARIEGLCGKLKKRLLISKCFSTYLSNEEISFVDTFELKGIKEPAQVFEA